MQEEEETIAPVKAASQFTAVPTTTAAAPAYVASSTVPASEVDSARIYGSSYSGVSFGSAFSPDNLLLTDRRPLRSRSLVCFKSSLTPVDTAFLLYSYSFTPFAKLMFV